MVVTKRFVDGTLQVAGFSGHSPLFWALPEPQPFSRVLWGYLWLP